MSSSTKGLECFTNGVYREYGAAGWTAQYDRDRFFDSGEFHAPSQVWYWFVRQRSRWVADGRARTLRAARSAVRAIVEAPCSGTWR
jgi:hypothetical protein